MSRIMMISDHADPLASPGVSGAGGQNVYVRDLSSGLAASGFEVDVYTRDDGSADSSETLMVNGARVIRLQAGPTRPIPRDSFSQVLPEFVARLKEQIRRNDPYSLVHSSYWYSGLAALSVSRFAALPHIHSYCSIGAIRHAAMGAAGSSGAHIERRNGAEALIAQRSDLLVAGTCGESQALQSLFGVSEEKVKIIPNFVDCSIFSPQVPGKDSKVLSAIRLSPNQETILYVGRLERRKGIETLLRAMPGVLAARPTVRLVIAGSANTDGTNTNEQARLASIARGLNLEDHIFFAGAIDRFDLPEIYSLANICIVPSYYEPFGIVAIESLACGTPVVASNVGGLKEIVNSDVGRTVRPWDFERLAVAIVDMLRLGKHQFHESCRDRALSHYSKDVILERYVQLIEEMTISVGLHKYRKD